MRKLHFKFYRHSSTCNIRHSNIGDCSSGAFTKGLGSDPQFVVKGVRYEGTIGEW